MESYFTRSFPLPKAMSSVSLSVQSISLVSNNAKQTGGMLHLTACPATQISGRRRLQSCVEERHLFPDQKLSLPQPGTTFTPFIQLSQYYFMRFSTGKTFWMSKTSRNILSALSTHFLAWPCVQCFQAKQKASCQWSGVKASILVFNWMNQVLGTNLCSWHTILA